MDPEKKFYLAVLDNQKEQENFVKKLRENKCFRHYIQPMVKDEKTRDIKICVIYLHTNVVKP
jgi:hypothetical protein